MVNYKQMVGLIILSIGIILVIYAVRLPEEEKETLPLVAGIAMLLVGGTIALLLNRK